MGSLDASGLRIAIVVGRFNDLVTKLLLEGALDAFNRHGGASSEVRDLELLHSVTNLPLALSSSCR